MHETYFGLRKRPFLAIPTLDRYCPIECQESAFATAVRAIQRSEGPVSIVGGTGLGKSMVCLRIADTFRRSYEVVMLASSQLCSRRALLQSLLFELRMPYRDLSEGELRLSLLERLQPSNDNPTDGLVLIVDEAQSLAPKLLEELRLITNLTRDGVPRVRLVLCGTTRLEEMLGHPQMESLNQRLAARCYLTPLNSTETIQYLTYKIELCGAPISAVITDDAMRLVHRATDGVLRLVDQVVDSAIRMAAEQKQRPISASMIESAWAHSQQLPMPWNDNAQSIATAAPSIEFGLLEEDTEQDFQGRDNSYVHSHKSNLFYPTTADAITASQPANFETETDDDTNYSVDPEVAYYEESIGLAPKPSLSIQPVPSAGSGLSRSIPNAWDSFAERNESPRTAEEVQPTTNNSLFGTDYEEEIWLTTQPEVKGTSNHSPSSDNPAGWTTQQLSKTAQSIETPSNRYNVPIEVVSDDQIDSSLYAFRETALGSQSKQQDMKSFSMDSELDVDILDQISTSNLEAMTIAAHETLLESSAPRSNSATGSHHPTYSSIPNNSVVGAFNPGSIVSKPSQVKLSRPPRASILSFADIQQDSSDQLQDDRDLLVIEEDVMHISSGVPTPSAFETVSSASVHPYKQIFSKLRG